jgi:hypothetical protein
LRWALDVWSNVDGGKFSKSIDDKMASSRSNNMWKERRESTAAAYAAVSAITRLPQPSPLADGL